MIIIELVVNHGYEIKIKINLFCILCQNYNRKLKIF